MIFKDQIVKNDMISMHTTIDDSILEFQKFVAGVKKQGVGYESKGVQDRLQKVTKRLFEHLNGLARSIPYGGLCVASKETRDYVFPYYGKGFVRYAVRHDMRRFVLYRTDGSMLEVKQLLNGYVTVSEGRYQQIKGIVMVDDNWRKYAEEKKRKYAKV